MRYKEEGCHSIHRNNSSEAERGCVSDSCRYIKVAAVRLNNGEDGTGPLCHGTAPDDFKATIINDAPALSQKRCVAREKIWCWLCLVLLERLRSWKGSWAEEWSLRYATKERIIDTMMGYIMALASLGQRLWNIKYKGQWILVHSVFAWRGIWEAGNCDVPLNTTSLWSLIWCISREDTFQVRARKVPFVTRYSFALRFGGLVLFIDLFQCEG